MNRFAKTAVLATLAFAANSAVAADVTIGIQLEPPHLDSTSAAAGAIDQVLYSNVFEGLTRFGPDGSVALRGGSITRNCILSVVSSAC